jgi:hypothetical protein
MAKFCVSTGGAESYWLATHMLGKLPPRVAPKQVVIIPILKSSSGQEQVRCTPSFWGIQLFVVSILWVFVVSIMNTQEQRSSLEVVFLNMSGPQQQAGRGGSHV